MTVETFKPSPQEVAAGVEYAHAWLVRGPHGQACVSVVMFLTNGEAVYGAWASKLGDVASIAGLLKRARAIAIHKARALKPVASEPHSLREALDA